MPQTFVLPRQFATADGLPASGAVASFFRTGTSTDQVVYADAALSTPVTSITADSAGVFQKVYLNPNAPFDYRVRIESASGVLIAQDDDISAQPFSHADIVAALYPQTDAENAAGINPSDFSHPPGHILRYGPTGDGTADDTVALTSLFASGADELVIEGGTFSVAGTFVLSQDRTRVSMSNAVLKVRGETGAGTGVINLTADDCDVFLDFDCNHLGVGGITVAGDRNRVYARGKDLTRTVASGTSESLVKVTGSDNTIWAEGYDLVDGGIAGAVPRIVSLQGTGANNTVLLLKGRNVVDGLVSTQTDTVIDCIDLDEVTDNGLYLLSTCARIKINGGTIRNAAEPLVIECADVDVGPVAIIDNTSSIALFDASRIRFIGTSMKHRDNTLATAFIATRSGNTTCTDITLQGCKADINVNNGGIAHFSTGAVNDFKVLGGHYKLTWTDESDASTRIVTHSNATTSVVYKDVIVDLVDLKAVPMGGGDILNLDIPDVSATSTYDGVRVINNTAAVVREGAVGAISQANLHVRSEAAIGSGGLYLGGISSTARRVAKSAASPTAGTWGVGDIVWNTGPTVDVSNMLILGWVCTVAGTSGTWVPMRVSTVSPAT